MTFVHLMTFILASASGLVQALLANHDPQVNTLTGSRFHDSRMDEISCAYKECPYSDAKYPESALTTRRSGIPQSESLPVDDEKPCCCCDISIPAISCRLRPEKDGCICAMVMCPPGSPTIWPGSTPPPSTTATPAPTDQREKINCCCCDISAAAISCSLKDAADGCFCVDVKCPVGASTIWPDGTPTPTPTAFY